MLKIEVQMEWSRELLFIRVGKYEAAHVQAIWAIFPFLALGKIYSAWWNLRLPVLCISSSISGRTSFSKINYKKKKIQPMLESSENEWNHSVFIISVYFISGRTRNVCHLVIIRLVVFVRIVIWQLQRRCVCVME